MIKIIKPAKDYLAHYKVACPRCEAIMEFDGTDILEYSYGTPYFHIKCSICGKLLPAYSFVEIKND